jgi:hypothetical protein
MQLISRRDLRNCFGLADRIHTALATHGSAMHLHLPPLLHVFPMPESVCTDSPVAWLMLHLMKE